MSVECLIWSNEHRAWWGPNSIGYVRDVASAGRFSIEDARELVISAQIGRRVSPRGEFIEPPPELVVRLEDVVQCGIS